MKFFKHLGVVIKHKHYVFKYACKLGIPFIGFFHDYSKYSATEFWRSVRYFAGDKSPTILEREEEYGFSYICAHHTGRNKHHWQYWVDYDRQNIVINRIPYKHALEYVCDIIAASKVYHPKNFTFDVVYDYFERHSKRYLMHPATKEFILACVSFLQQHKMSKLKKRVSRPMYEEISAKYPPTIFLDYRVLALDKLDIKA